MRFETFGKLVAVLALAALPVAASLAQEPEIVQQREALMKGMGKQMGAVKALIGGPAGNLGQVKQHADAVVESSKKIPGLFPPGSEEGDTEALPVAWTDQEGFAKAAARLGELAADLGASADSGDARQVAAAFAAVGKEGCSGCHQTYRKPQT